MIHNGCRKINSDVEDFEAAVMKLSNKIGQAGTLWGDEKFAELSKAISQIANMSVDVITKGRECNKIVADFDKIAEEKY